MVEAIRNDSIESVTRCSQLELVSRAHQIYKQPNRSRNSRRQLTEKCVPAVDVQPLAILRDQHSPLLIRLIRVMARELRLKVLIPCTHEIDAALLHPTVEIRLRDFVRAVKNRVTWGEYCHRSFFHRN